MRGQGFILADAIDAIRTRDEERLLELAEEAHGGPVGVALADAADAAGGVAWGLALQIVAREQDRVALRACRTLWLAEARRVAAIIRSIPAGEYYAPARRDYGFELRNYLRHARRAHRSLCALRDARDARDIFDAALSRPAYSDAARFGAACEHVHVATGINVHLRPAIGVVEAVAADGRTARATVLDGTPAIDAARACLAQLEARA